MRPPGRILTTIVTGAFLFGSGVYVGQVRNTGEDMGTQI